MLKTIEFFENKGLANVKKDDHDRAWYGDFLEFVKKEQAFSILMTPSGYGEGDSRWDTARICEFNEILGFYNKIVSFAFVINDNNNELNLS